MQTTISATELARNTREILDRICSSGETIAIERNQTTIAQMKPAQRAMTAAQALSGLQLPVLTAKQSNAWLADSKEGFGDEVRDPWA